MRTFGQTVPFSERAWEELDSDWSARLDRAAMYDLLVAERPIPDPPYTVVIVRSPVSVKPPAPGMVAIEHTSLTGRTDRIERSVTEAVPLFWRFMAEKFGVSAAQGR